MNQYQIISLAAGLLYITLPLMTWTILQRWHRRRPVVLWCGGCLCYGVGILLIGMRAMAPGWVFLLVAGPLAFASYPLRATALRLEAGLPWQRGACWMFGGVSLALHLFLQSDRLAGDDAGIFVTAGMHAIGSVWLSREAGMLHRRKSFRSAAVLRWVFAGLAVVLAMRFLAVAAGLRTLQPVWDMWIFQAMVVCSTLAALYANLGYIGIALESTRVKELARAGELAREHERRVQSELRGQEQGRLLDERTALLAQREEMLATLAHEVRQPLNNASAALESTARVIAGGDGAQDRASANDRLQRARAVLTQVTSSLDNTLADAVLLGGTEPARRQDADVDTLVELAIADIDIRERARVRVERATATRTAAMNVGLMRLALRNLIGNALAYSPPGTKVTVRIEDSDEPLALLIDVCDEGPGFPAELMPRLFTRGGRGAQVRNRLGHGLGLHIVWQVMQLHGGTVEVRRNTPGGLCMRLVLPQGFQA